MALFETNAPRRAWQLFAFFFKSSHKTPPRIDQLPKDLSDHIARDIGLSAHELELLRHRMPSQRPNRRGI